MFQSCSVTSGLELKLVERNEIFSSARGTFCGEIHRQVDERCFAFPKGLIFYQIFSYSYIIKISFTKSVLNFVSISVI